MIEVCWNLSQKDDQKPRYVFMTSIVKCPACEGTATASVYKPLNSNLNCEIARCAHCKHVFQVQLYRQANTQPSEVGRKDTFQGLSCDADYSAIRIGKAQMLKASVVATELVVETRGAPRKILDVSAARGDFANWALQRFNPEGLVCVEPDSYMTESYKREPRIRLIEQDLREARFDELYDLIYCCHSLEHYRDPRVILTILRGLLSPRGIVYLEVPNIDYVTSASFIVEEYFYDQHKQFFNRDSLLLLLREVGLQVVLDKSDLSSLRVVCEHSDPEGEHTTPIESSFIRDFDFVRYRQVLEYSRSRLPLAADKLISEISGAQTLAVVGAGRIFDAFVKSGSLSRVTRSFEKVIVIDNFISRLTSSINGLPLVSLDSWTGREPDCALILATSSSAELRRNVRNFFPSCTNFELTELIP